MDRQDTITDDAAADDDRDSFPDRDREREVVPRDPDPIIDPKPIDPDPGGPEPRLGVADEFEGRIVVPNYEAKTGDVTLCPYSGRKFVVEADSPRLVWRSKSWVLCADEPMDEIQANPEKYLEKYLDDDAR